MNNKSSNPNRKLPKIAIMLSTYNGDKYLAEQIDSIINQTFENWLLLIRDDSSSDRTLALLHQYALQDKRIFLINDSTPKQNIGAMNSYSALLEYALNNSTFEYFMFCDQDDFWFPDKIAISIEAMHKLEYQANLSFSQSTNKKSQIPLLTFTDKIVTDDNLNTISDSFFKYQKLSPHKMTLRNLIIQNTPSACTMLFNRTLAKKASPIPGGAYMHDHWISLVNSSFGLYKFINTPSLLYRQHKENVFGAKGATIAYFLKKLNLTKIKQARSVLLQYSNQAKVFSERYKEFLTNDQLQMLNGFSDLFEKNWVQRRLVLAKHGILKHGFLRNIGLFLLL